MKTYNPLKLPSRIGNVHVPYVARITSVSILWFIFGLILIFLIPGAHSCSLVNHIVAESVDLPCKTVNY